VHVSDPRVHRQEEGCIYRYGIGCITCISIRSLVGGRVDFGELTLPPTRLLILKHVKRTIP
jgi:hypothetical protein